MNLGSGTISPRTATNGENLENEVIDDTVGINGAKVPISPHLKWKMPTNFSFYSPRSVSRTKINKIR